MKIQYALMSCNAHQRYTQCWPMIARCWLRLGITPVCLFIPDKPQPKLPAGPAGSIVHIIPPLPNVHITIQVTMCRFWASYLYPNSVVTISDMDVIPLSQYFFINQLAKYPDNVYLYLKPYFGAYAYTDVSNIPEKTTHISNMRYLQSCFHTAQGKVMRNVLELPSDWETTCTKIMPYYLQKEAKITTTLYSWQSHREEVPWYGEEIYCSIRLHHSNHHPIHYSSYQYGGRYLGLFIARRNNMIRGVDINKTRWIAIHIHSAFSLKRIGHIEDRLIKGKVPRSQLVFEKCITLTYMLIQKNKILRSYISLALNVLLLLAIRLFPLYKISKITLLRRLFIQRKRLAKQHPFLMRLYHRIKSE